MKTPTQAQIARALAEKGTNLCAWSRGRGYNYRTVHTAVKRWAGRTDRMPHGGTSRQIMSDLASYVDDGQRHGHLD